MICRKVPNNPIDKQKNEALIQAMNEGGKSSRNEQAKKTTELSPEMKARIYKELGMTDNYFYDYLNWLGRTLSGDLGTSYNFQEPVSDMIVRRMPISIFYGLLSMFFIYGVCIPLGIFKALRNGGIFDNVTSILVFIGYAVPGFALGAILVVFAAAQWGWFPIGSFVSDGFDQLSFFEKVKDLMYHAVLPMCCYLVGGFAFMTMLVKNSLLDNLSADYIKTALSKGVSYKRAVFKHALDNSLIPLATHFGNNISLIIGGSFLIEKIFNIDGMGLLSFEAIEGRDIAIVMGTLTIGCILQMLGNLFSDICVAYVDPRIKFD